jgi:coenzyme F420 hydrogenase subunit beta
MEPHSRDPPRIARSTRCPSSLDPRKTSWIVPVRCTPTQREPLVLEEATASGVRELALVGMGCRASINGSVRARGLGRIASRLAITIGLLCSKTFTYEGQVEVLENHGIAIEDVIRVDVKGRFIVWTRDRRRVEIPLSEFYPHTRPGCQLCPDFAAEHADISAGGIGEDGWTLVVVRTQRGEDWIRGMQQHGILTVRPGEDDPQAMRLLRVLSKTSRRRWPTNTLTGPEARPGLFS